MSTATYSPAEQAARLAAQGPVRTAEPVKPQRKVLERFPAGAPRGSWPAEEFAQQQRRQGVAAEVVMDLASDSYLVVVA
ncbi:hypothetical protein [Streptomyces echinatus]|uniref:Uncharacterized protein n=1 Tax=Streptomyces echinatus TaxID=67293 RepID=A0A7W9UW62_9ACTN|nr:hypothetical protein [Streptomyces echinatus]MBB5932339.1 hypothetical protein [Streptomyces echinatus]